MFERSIASLESCDTHKFHVSTILSILRLITQSKVGLGKESKVCRLNVSTFQSSWSSKNVVFL